MSAQIPQIEVGNLPPDVALLDVREDDEWAAGHVDGALHVPMNELPNKLSYEPDILERSAPVVVLCRSGGRSAQVTAWLVHNGYDACNLVGGMQAWSAAGRPMVSADGSPPRVA